MMYNFSVVIPTYNRPHTLLRAIGSVLSCDKPPDSEIEVIVVNDGGNWVDIGGMTKGNVTIINSLSNIGISAARNVGVQEAKHSWICVLDDDDWYQPNYFKLLKKAIIEQSDKEFFYTAFWDWNCGDEIYCYFRQAQSFQPEKLSRAIYRKDFIGASTMSFTKHAWQSVGGFDADLRCNEDWDYKIKMCKMFGAGIVETAVVNITTHENGIYKQCVKSGLAKQTERIVKERYKELAE